MPSVAIQGITWLRLLSDCCARCLCYLLDSTWVLEGGPGCGFCSGSQAVTCRQAYHGRGRNINACTYHCGRSAAKSTGQECRACPVALYGTWPLLSESPACAGASGGSNETWFGDPATALQRQQHRQPVMQWCPSPHLCLVTSYYTLPLA